MSFLPDDYVAPKSNSAYTKFEQGDTRIRIISKAIVGMETWSEKKPHRFRMNEPITVHDDQGNSPKHFWAFVVWNYNTEQVEICEITQAGIRNMITQYNLDEDFGDPKGYDIIINRSGEGLDTKYSIIAKPPKALVEEVANACSKVEVNLDALFDGEDPFKVSDKSEQVSNARSAFEDTPMPEEA